jgi:hypothetical protein
MKKYLINRLLAIAQKRPADYIIGGIDDPYLRRWFVIPRNPVFNIYLHQFLRSDDDRALHDHPWLFNASVMLLGQYLEHTIKDGGVEVVSKPQTGDWKFRWGPAPHRVELFHAGFATGNGKVCAIGNPLSCWTVFITGPRVREWGFHCPQSGWIHWKAFTARDDKGAIGKGCDA